MDKNQTLMKIFLTLFMIKLGINFKRKLEEAHEDILFLKDEVKDLTVLLNA